MADRMISVDVQFHSPPVLIHCLGQTSLINPSTFLLCSELLLCSWVAPISQLVHIVFAILTVGNFFPLHKGWELGCQKGVRPSSVES